MFGILLSFLMIGMLTFALNVQRAKTTGTLSGRVEGSADGMLIVSDFTTLPVGTFYPLTYQLENEGCPCTFLDIIQSASVAGRDAAEKLRDCLHDMYELSPFKYLLLTDVVFPNASHLIPVRVFTPSWAQILTSWNDYYYANLVGDFDVNGNGIYGENWTDMSNVASVQLVVGRLVLDSQNCVEELQNYVSADIAYRVEKNMQSTFIVIRDSDTGGWSHPLIANLTSLTTDLGYQTYPHIYNYTDAAMVADSIANSSLVYFGGHGALLRQQIGWYGGEYEYDGPYLIVDDVKNMTDSKPSVMIFGGCNTGSVYDTADTNVATITIAVAPMDYLPVPAVSVLANTGTGAIFADTHYKILYSSITQPIAEAILDQHVKELLGLSAFDPGFPYYEPGAFTYGYFGDPTIHLAIVRMQRADINGDGIVDLYDAIILANAYSTTPGSPNWLSAADINHDNIVDIYDAILLSNHYNEHNP